MGNLPQELLDQIERAERGKNWLAIDRLLKQATDIIRKKYQEHRNRPGAKTDDVRGR